MSYFREIRELEEYIDWWVSETMRLIRQRREEEDRILHEEELAWFRERAQQESDGVSRIPGRRA